VALPRGSGATARKAETPAAGRAPVPHALIAVIDDELAIRQAMGQLLESWGHSVITGGSSAALIAGVADTAVPDLIICDYRLREGETGVAVIAALRRHFGKPVAAMLITGDTAPDRIAEAQASGFLLLHKPLAAGKLRAAIGHLLRPQPPEART
jgi:CheY-like chemotaxis protein